MNEYIRYKVQKNEHLENTNEESSIKFFGLASLPFNI